MAIMPVSLNGCALIAACPGEIRHMDGSLLGTHQGVLHYTVGQRRGLGVATGDPLYVVSIDADKREVIVGPRDALARAALCWMR